ncbi:MAG: archaeosortase/exosortase family protein [Deltaproteobacteria bacterium]|nr:archaeosortase/exosortase family protein [Deltaproteobacteria bacterium]
MAEKGPRRAKHRRPREVGSNEAGLLGSVRGGRELVMCGAYVVLAVGLSLVLLSDLVFDDLLGGLRTAVASVAGATFRAVGLPIETDGTILRGPGTALIIVNECTGIDATILLASAILVFPAGLGQKLAGLGLAVAVMMVLNFVRVLSLIWIGNYSPDLLDVGHLYVWPPIVILVGIGTLLLWANRVVADPA